MLKLKCKKKKNVAKLTNIPYRWFHESARWLALKNKPDQAIKGLKSVAKFNRRCDEGEKIDIKVREYLKLWNINLCCT